MSELNLFQKIVEVRKSIEVFTKDSKSYGYSYVSGSQVLGAIKKKMDELNLVLYPEMEEVVDTTYDYTVWDKISKSNKEKTDFVIKGNMNYIWINADKPDETLRVPWKIYGQQDDISKAFGSSLTYSERYFLLKFFGAPTDEDDPDAKKSGDRGRGQQSVGNAAPATEKQLNYINKLLKEKVTDRLNEQQLYALIKQRIKTNQEMENWTADQASNAIKILSQAS